MRVLFVDDEPQVLRGIERMLDAADVDWDVQFAESGQEAIEILEDAPVETLVTDMRMPGMDGAELLQLVGEKFPEIVRVVLSGQADKEAVFRAVQPMHQYLAKPCDAKTLTATISRAFALRKVLNSESLHSLISGLSSLPSLPTIYQQLMKELESETSTLERVGEIISQDPAMTAKILQIVNSAMFGLRNPVRTPDRAASFLGIDTIKALALSIGVFREFDGNGMPGFSIDQLMSHSLKVAMYSRAIAAHEEEDSDFQNNAFTAGVLHDIGKLILVSSYKDNFYKSLELSKENQLPLWKAEREVFGSDHAAVGAHLLNIWGLPQSIIEVVALHHNPVEAHETEFSIMTAVSAANFIHNCSTNNPPLDPQPFEDYLSTIGADSKLDSWTNVCLNLEEMAD
ncbi:MAG: response regulator [Planctomycetota bacterium]